MDRREMLRVLLLLADGVNPDTGEIYDNDSPYQSTVVTRALFQALRELEPDDGKGLQSPSEKSIKAPFEVPPLGELGQALLEQLRTWRNATAKAANLSSFMILSNKAISHIAFIRPRTTGDLLKAYGVGPSKVAQFGGEILDIVKSVVPAETVERDATCLGAASTNGAWKEPSEGRRALKGEQGLPSRAYAPWSPTEDQELKRLHGEGHRVPQLAQRLGRKPGAITSRLGKLGLS